MSILVYRIVVYLSDTASECVLQEVPRAVVVDISICGVTPVLIIIIIYEFV